MSRRIGSEFQNVLCRTCYEYVPYNEYCNHKCPDIVEKFRNSLKQQECEDGAITFGKGKDRNLLDQLHQTSSGLRHMTESESVNPIIINKDNNSFLSTVVLALSRMIKIKNHILFDIDLSERDGLVYYLKSTLTALEKNPRSYSIEDLRRSLSDTFQSRRKFIRERPDDPSDAFFALLNSFHSYSTRSPLIEINDTSCNMRCLAHKFFFFDLMRYDVCECKGSSKRLFSYHNYIFDIPIKVDSYKQLSELNGNLFTYARSLLVNTAVTCPVKGARCMLNRVKTSYALMNDPAFLTFSLYFSSPSSKLNIFKTFAMIPRRFDLSTLFESENKRKYELFSFICLTSCKNYSLFYKSNNNTWIWSFEEQTIKFSNWEEVAFKVVKCSEVPVLLFYQQQHDVEHEEHLANHCLINLERYCRNADNFDEITKYKFRPVEQIINYNVEIIQPVKMKESFNIPVKSHAMSSYHECPSCHTRNKHELTKCIQCGQMLINDNEDMVRKSLNSNIQIRHENKHTPVRIVDKSLERKSNMNLPKQMPTETKIIRPKPSDPMIKIVDEECQSQQSKSEWKCQVCGKLNNRNEYKCYACGKKDLKMLENMLANENRRKVDLHKNISSSKNTIDSSKDEDQMRETAKKNFNVNSCEICLCHKYNDDRTKAIFINNICRICGRQRLDESIRQPNLLRHSTETSSIGKAPTKLQDNKKKSIHNNFINNPNVVVKTENVKYINDNVNYKILKHYDSNKKEKVKDKDKDRDKDKDYYSQYSALAQNRSGLKPNIVVKSHMKK